MGKRLAWIIPLPTAGSGGIRTIFAYARALQAKGYENDFYILAEDHSRTIDVEEVSLKVKEWFSFDAKIMLAASVPNNYDAIIATFWKTAYFANVQDVERKVYFIQDFEPWMYPKGDEYIAARRSYSLGLFPITIGKWLSAKIASVSKIPSVPHTIFGVDLNTYHPIEGAEKEEAVCAILQPGKFWRLPSFVEEALYMLSQLRPQLTIYTFGSNDPSPFLDGPSFRHLGIISPEELNELYNICQCGICLSCSNPSRISFEMMASGLPAIELKSETTSIDFPQKAMTFCDPIPSALTERIEWVLDHPEERDAMSSAGIKHMSSQSLDIEASMFVDGIERIMAENVFPDERDPIADMETSLYKSRYDRLLMECSPLNAQEVSVEVYLYDKAADGIKVFVWSKEDQSDLHEVWLPCITEGRFAGKIPLPFCDVLTQVHLHFYSAASDLPDVFLRGISKGVRNSNMSGQTRWTEAISIPGGKICICDTVS